jgi:endonuclease/exonuclease/phosphatase family metal-dependent hydrolase
MSRSISSRSLVLVVAGTALAPGVCVGQLRIATWNVSGYNGNGREQAFKLALYGEFEGRQLAPDVLLVQEARTPAGHAGFLAILNTASGSPGDWQAGPFISSPDGNTHAFFYRTSKVQLLDATVVSQGGPSPQHPRHLQRYDIRPAGYAAPAATLACYASHMKAGSASADQQRRLVEAQAIRGDAEILPEGWHFLLAGDLNIYRSTETAYQWLIGAQVNDRGRLFDPIRTPGTWTNNQAFRFVHTQAPAGSVGMDDRFDHILLSAMLLDGRGLSYIGDAGEPHSTATWNDPMHSYRVWGNDGTSFRQTITIATNTMVGPAIAQALYDAAATDLAGGHLPVFLDLRVPAKVDSVLLLDFGDVELGASGGSAQRPLTVRNSGDVGLWSAAGIADLRYMLEAPPGFAAPAGSFAAAPGVPGVQHAITIETGTLGLRQGVLTIISDAPDQPMRHVLLTGTIIPPCYANCDRSTTPPVLNVEDFSCFINEFAAGALLSHQQQLSHYANCDQSTTAPVLNVEDFTCFINAFAAGCR